LLMPERGQREPHGQHDCSGHKGERKHPSIVSPRGNTMSN
jgi:hypothetical protein